MDPQPSPNGLRLFGRTLGRSGNSPAQSPSSSQLSQSIVHHKPRIVSPLRAEENSGSELEVEEIAPTSNPITQTPVNTTPARQSPPAARVIVTPKNKLKVAAVAEDNDDDEVIDGTYEANDDYEEEEYDSQEIMNEEDVDTEYIEVNNTNRNRLKHLTTDKYYTEPPHPSIGKGVLGKRTKGKSYGSAAGSGGKAPRGVGGKAPRGVGGKAPRLPHGRGKAPAWSHKEREDQGRRKVRLLDELPNNNNNNTKATKSKKKPKKKASGLMPVGKKPEKTPKKQVQWIVEVRKYQRSTLFMIPKKRFHNLVRDIVTNKFMENRKWARTGLEALQCAAEEWVTEVIDLANLCTLHAGRVTLMPRDFELVRQLVRAKVKALHMSLFPDDKEKKPDEPPESHEPPGSPEQPESSQD